MTQALEIMPVMMILYQLHQISVKYLNLKFQLLKEFELKKMGIACDFPAVKLKTGSGEQVV